MLADDPAPEVRTSLLTAMHSSLQALRTLVEASPEAVRALEQQEVETVALNIAAMGKAIEAAENPGSNLPPAEQWRTVLLAFDELAGRDMRELLRQAVERNESASLDAGADLAAALSRIRLMDAVLAAGVFGLALLSITYFVRRLDRPFAELARLSTALAAGDFSARSELRGRDEFARIGTLLDSMAERLAEAQARSQQLQAQLDELVAERTRSLSHAFENLLGIEARRRQFFAELSHELRTPVTVIRGEAEVALRNRSNPNAQGEALVRIIEATSDLGGRVQDLLDAARGGSLEYALTIRREPLHSIIAAAVEQMQAIAEHRSLQLLLRAPVRDKGCMVDADRERLQQALVIVLDNALRYSPQGGTVVVDLAEEPDHWVVSIDDRGPGMTEEELQRAFEPQFRGSAGQQLAPQGQGLGLPIALRIVEALGGGIELHNRDGGGLRVSIALPISLSETAA
jgi:signal transduction histidine kinase